MDKRSTFRMKSNSTNMIQKEWSWSTDSKNYDIANMTNTKDKNKFHMFKIEISSLD